MFEPKRISLMILLECVKRKFVLNPIQFFLFHCSDYSSDVIASLVRQFLAPFNHSYITSKKSKYKQNIITGGLDRRQQIECCDRLFGFIFFIFFPGSFFLLKGLEKHFHHNNFLLLYYYPCEVVLEEEKKMQEMSHVTSSHC